jgi:hypothetical protein
VRNIARLVLFLSLALACVTEARASGDVVKVGVLNDQTGMNADLSGQGSVIAARMAAEDAGGSVIGKKIEIVFADHQNKADVGSSIATQWYDKDGVDVIADLPFSSVALAVQEIAKQRQKIVLFSGPGSSDLTGKACSPFGFHWTFDTVALARHRVRGGEERRRYLVFLGGRLRVWPRAGEGYDPGGARQWRQGAGPGDPPGEHLGFFLLSRAGAGFGCEGDRARQRGDGYHQLDQAGT